MDQDDVFSQEPNVTSLCPTNSPKHNILFFILEVEENMQIFIFWSKKGRPETVKFNFEL